ARARAGRGQKRPARSTSPESYWSRRYRRRHRDRRDGCRESSRSACDRGFRCNRRGQGRRSQWSSAAWPAAWCPSRHRGPGCARPGHRRAIASGACPRAKRLDAFYEAPGRLLSPEPVRQLYEEHVIRWTTEEGTGITSKVELTGVILIEPLLRPGHVQRRARSPLPSEHRFAHERLEVEVWIVDLKRGRRPFAVRVYFIGPTQLIVRDGSNAAAVAKKVE